MAGNVKKNNQIKYALFFLAVICALVYFFSSYNQCYLSTGEACTEGRLIEVASRTSGVLIHLYADNNQEVKKGDLLLEIDPVPYETRLRELETEIKSLKEKLDKCTETHLEDYPQNSYPEYARTYTHIDCIKQRKDKIKPDNMNTIKEQDKEQNEESLNEDEPEDEVLNAGELSARLRELETQAAEVKLELSYTKVYAPQDGTVASKKVQEGDYIETGECVLSVIPKRVWIIADFKQTELLSAGQPVRIKLKSYPHKTFKGVVDTVPYSINPRTDYLPQNTGGADRMTVKILFTEDYSQYNIPPGSSAALTVKVK